MKDCRIKRILDKIDPVLLKELILTEKWIYIGIPKELVELYLKDKEAESNGQEN